MDPELVKGIIYPTLSGNTSGSPRRRRQPKTSGRVFEFIKRLWNWIFFVVNREVGLNYDSQINYEPVSIFFQHWGVFRAVG